MTAEREWIVRGKVSTAHGIQGQVRLALSTDFPERVLDAKELTLRLPDGSIEVRRLEKASVYKTGLMLKLAGIDDRNAAEALRGAEVVADKSELPALPDDEIYWHQLMGLRVVTVDGQEVGEITDILRTGSNDVYVTEVPSATGRGKRPGPLIPAIDDVLERVDPEAGVVIIRPMPGLLD
ncbi:MAG: 16S rRNA processing protein RimM [Armatimonadetes bacterium]|nr:16S rRNA processing protein RimM [Armatimonadota bacterium]